jgi:hypothetical protein
MGRERVVTTATVGEYTFTEVTNPGFDNGLDTMWRFEIEGDSTRSTYAYESLDEAMAFAIAAKYTGHQGASGTGVSTAAYWFMKMIGADKDA